MKKGKILSILIGTALSVWFAATTVNAQINQQQKPNVLMISIDDLNDWIGIIGNQTGAITPNMDRLAKNGVLFSNAHCQAPVCGPSRASLMTGLRPSTTGIYGMIADNDISKASKSTKDIIFLPEYLKITVIKLTV